jgi:Amt family ammonium transporter
VGLVALLLTEGSNAGEKVTVSEEMFRVNNLWILISAFLVFMMHLGFATLESGLTRAKNTVNILFKNISVVAIGILTYATIGFSLMYGKDIAAGIIGWNGLGLALPEGGETIAYSNGAYTFWSDFIFQGMFAATAATIVSGAVAERIKLSSFLIFSTIYVAIIYPIIGFWKWGGGWLDALGFHDFAGAALVHAVGGFAALAGIIILGPRTGKYINKASKPIPGHSLPLASIGVFLLWFGWYGFNGGSVLSADPAAVSRVFVITTLGAAAGVLGAMLTSWLVQKKPDLSMVLNGSLAGLVGITAGADVLSPGASIIIGLIAGIIVVLAVLIIDAKLRLDDPVGATSVHLVCGVWGTIATGIFSAKSFAIQLLGISVIGAVAFISALILFWVIKKTMGLRVSTEEEQRGLDIGEHGIEAYHGFQIFSTL